MSFRVTIEERSPNLWRLAGRQSNRRALYRTVRGDQAAAEAAAAAWRAEATDAPGMPITPSMPLAALIRSTIDGATRLQARSRDYYTMAVRAWIDPTPPKTRAERAAWGRFAYDYNIGRRQIFRLQPNDAAEFQRHLLARGLSVSTVRLCVRLCRKACDEAVRFGVIPANPFAAIRTIQPPEQHRVIPEIQELRAAQADEWPCAGRHGLLIRLAIATGARRNELLALTWHDIDLDADRLRISKALEQRAGAISVKVPKTRAANRHVPLPPAIVAELRGARAAAAELALAKGLRLERLPVLPDKDGFSWWSPMAATQAGKRALARLKIKDCSLHALRHVYATTLMSRGLHPRAVQTLLGHARMSTLLTTYVHPVESDEAVARDLIARATGGAAGSPVRGIAGPVPVDEPAAS